LAEQLSQRLAKKGHEVWVYSPANTKAQTKSLNGALIQEITIPGWLPGAVQTILYDYLSLVDAKRKGFDLILECGYGFSPLLYLFGRRIRNSIVTNMDGMEWQRPKWGLAARLFLRWAESLAVKFSHSIVTDHPEIKKYYLEKYGCDSTLIAYGVDFQTIASPSPPLAKPNDYLLIVSRPEPDNSLTEIMQAFTLSSCPLPLLIVGNFTNRFGKTLQAKYTSPKVVFLGGIYDKSRLNQLRKNSLLYLHGHRVGGTNPALLEAMASGCRIVAHGNPYNRAVLKDGAAYFETVSDLIQIFSHAYEYARTLSDKTSENIMVIGNQYQWDTVADRYERLFLSVSGNKVGNTPDFGLPTSD